MSLKCPNGHIFSLELVDMPNTSSQRFLCRKCGAEAVIRFLGTRCRCGCKRYTFRPLKGQESKPIMHREAEVNCTQCGRALADDIREEIESMKSESTSRIRIWLLLLALAMVVIIVIYWMLW